MVKTNKDIRWQQRFHNFNKAYKHFKKYVAQDEYNELEQQGLIKAFEYTYELAWKTLQDLLKEKGYKDITGPKPVIEQSFQDGYIANGEAWMRMHKSRNLTSHTYNEETAEELIQNIKDEYFSLFENIQNELPRRKRTGYP